MLVVEFELAGHAAVRNTASFEITGDECPSPGICDFHVTFNESFQIVGGVFDTLLPCKCSPRQPRHSDSWPYNMQHKQIANAIIGAFEGRRVALRIAIPQKLRS